MSSEVELTVALAVGRGRLLIAGRPVDMMPDETFTRLFEYDAARPEPWSSHDLPFRVVSLAKHVEPGGAAPTLHALSEEGDVEILGDRGRVVERIPGAGLYGRTSTRHGYVASIRSLGQRLYVCGDGGQVYRRLSPGPWERMDEGLLQPRGERDLLLLSAIGGPREDDLYAAGEVRGRVARLFHWDGARWSPVPLPPAGGITSIEVQAEDRVWLAGVRGALLVGDHRTGFVSLTSHRSSQSFRAVTRYRDTLYLASNHGLFRYDEEARRVVRARTDLAQELDDLHTVEHVDGVLWCVGAREIASFDGETWARLQHPDVPPLEG
jgi:hypothetical protein